MHVSDAMEGIDNIPFDAESISNIKSLSYWFSIVAKALAVGGILCLILGIGLASVALFLMGQNSLFMGFTSIYTIIYAIALCVQGAVLSQSCGHLELLLQGGDDQQQLVYVFKQLRVFFGLDLVMGLLVIIVNVIKFWSGYHV
ncbi:MAG: hypothetical protein AAFS10_18180 [Myxococcota bacterium]